MAIEVRSLQNVTVTELTDVFNDSFSDYIIPLHLTEQNMSFKLYSELIDLALSVGVYDEQRLVGFMLTGVRNEGAERYYYNAGTGVIPTYRGQGLVALMYEYALPIWKKEEKRINLFLEVIKGNDKAIKAYKTQGYEISRDLLCFKGDIQKVQQTSDDWKIKVVEEINWEVVVAFWDIQPSWQNSVAVLNKAKEDVRYQVAMNQGEIVGYIAYHKNSGKVFQIAVAKKHRNKKIGRLLFNEVAKTVNKPILVTNVDCNGVEIISFLKRIGLELFITQHEMILKFE
ncbi:MAG: GNAT family N-acetyltransferase [Flavobacteriaceae bacterium]|jgi:ribosomal protein S18 acetylase RimI-like enzyme|nr:GNAT family N-acetyltransferase [Flavobacteriaceae bacterium]